MAKPVQMLLQGIGIDLIYSFVIILCSLMIYYSTKEMYELSSYKGIKYFRYAFLFFAIAYLFKSFIKFMLVYFGASRIIDLNPRFMGPLTLFIFMFFGTLAIFYLVYSLLWKKWNERSEIILGIFYLLSIIISFIIITTKQVWVFIATSIFIFAISLFGMYLTKKQSKDKKKKNNIHTIYTLLFTFWILNMIEVLIPTQQIFQLILYLASLGVFLTILYKVVKSSGY